MFSKANKLDSRLRMAFIGPPGSGKTYSALAVASAMAEDLGGKVGFIDTERGSASKYADEFEFDVHELNEDQSPRAFRTAIKAANEAAYSVLVIDSLSHAWAGRNGALEMVDKVYAHSKSNNSFAAWRKVTPEHNQLVDEILASKCHIIVCMRSKTEWVIEENEKGKKVPRKIGLAPVMRDGIEYEFDVTGEIDLDHRLAISKSRCSALTDEVIHKPGKELATTLLNWLKGVAEPAKPKQTDLPDQILQALFEWGEQKDESLTQVKTRFLDPVGISKVKDAFSDQLEELIHNIVSAYGEEQLPIKIKTALASITKEEKLNV